MLKMAMTIRMCCTAAGEVFATLGMDRTELGNGVLLYIDLKHHRFAIWGGRGIYELVPEGFWDQTYNLARGHFKKWGNNRRLVQGHRTGGGKTEILLSLPRRRR